MKLSFIDEEFDAQFGFRVGKTYLGMADLGECFATAARIAPGDSGSWAKEWGETADRAQAPAAAV